MPKTSRTDIEQEKLHILSGLLNDRLDDIFEEFAIDVRRAGKLYVGCCPIHGGDNRGAFNLYPDGHSQRGNWYCKTHQCEKIFLPTIVGLIRGCISAKNGWTKGSNTGLAPFREVVKWCCDFLNVDWDSIKPNFTLSEKKRFNSTVDILLKRQIKEGNGWTREFFRSRVNLPSPFYLSKGFSKKVLEDYDVGESKVTDPNHEMFQRVVVPIFNDSGNSIVGINGRSIWDKCEKCGCYHDPSLSCPTKEYRGAARFSKWRVSGGFNKEDFLYNYWRAKEEIKRTGVIVLVEGPGDVWKAIEAGIKNVVAIMGTSVTDAQQIIIEASGAMTIKDCLDADEAGANASRELEKQFGKMFKIKKIKLPEGKKDFGDMTHEEIKNAVG